MKEINHIIRKKAKIRIFIIYGVSIILIFFGYHFFNKVENSDYNLIKDQYSDHQTLLQKMKKARENINAIETYDESLESAKSQNQIPSIGRIKLSIDSCMENINKIVISIESENKDELGDEVYQNFRTYQSNREIIEFLNDEMENSQGGGEGNPEVKIIIKDLINLINEADAKVNTAGKRASKDELDEVKRLVTRMKNKAAML